jgi:hypothetical protein
MVSFPSVREGIIIQKVFHAIDRSCNPLPFGFEAVGNQILGEGAGEEGSGGGGAGGGAPRRGATVVISRCRWSS